MEFKKSANAIYIISIYSFVLVCFLSVIEPSYAGYVDLGDNTILDTDMCLQWQKETLDINGDNTPDAMTWNEAHNNVTLFPIAGRYDWRLPSLSELRGLYYFTNNSPPPLIDTTFFPDTISATYWTSTELDLPGTQWDHWKWSVSFYDFSWGHCDGTYPRYVRAVRDYKEGICNKNYIGKLRVSPHSGPSNTTFHITGTGFSPGGIAYFKYYDANQNFHIVEIHPDSNGSISLEATGFPPGSYSGWVDDINTKRPSSPVMFEVIDSVPQKVNIKNGQVSITEPPREETTFGKLRIENGKKKIDKNYDTFVIVHGWNKEGLKKLPDWVIKMALAIENNNNSLNVVSWDWHEKARTEDWHWGGSDECWDWGKVPFDNTKDSGEYLARALKNKLPPGYNKNIHLIGHSLGTLVITYATKEAYDENYTFKSKMNHLVFLDSPCWGQVGTPGGDFLNNHKDDIFLENYYSALGKLNGYGVADVNIYLMKSVLKHNLFTKENPHGYSHLWYKSSINSFQDNELGDKNTPDPVAINYGFYWWNKQNRIGIEKEYSQQFNHPDWELLPGTNHGRIKGKIYDGANLLSSLASETKDKIEKWTRETRSTIYIKDAKTFNTPSSVANNVKNATGHAMQQSCLGGGIADPCGNLRIEHHSTTVVKIPVMIPSGTNALLLSYDWRYAEPGTLLEIFINDKLLYHFFAHEDVISGKKLTPWMGIKAYSGKKINLTFRLSNPHISSGGAIEIDDIVLANIKGKNKFPWPLFLPAIQASSGTIPGKVCGANKTYDCHRQCINDSTIRYWKGDGSCDDGSYNDGSYWIFLNCSAFQNDGGDCN